MVYPKLLSAFNPLILLALCACSFMLTACSSLDTVDSWVYKIPKVQLGEVTVVTEAGSNRNTAIEIEILLVQDIELLKKISELPARKWFEAREDIRKNYPGGFESFGWELSPRQEVRLRKTELSGKRAYAVVIFANYLASSEHRARIDNFKDGIIVRLRENEFVVTQR